MVRLTSFLIKLISIHETFWWVISPLMVLSSLILILIYSSTHYSFTDEFNIILIIGLFSIGSLIIGLLLQKHGIKLRWLDFLPV